MRSRRLLVLIMSVILESPDISVGSAYTGNLEGDIGMVWASDGVVKH